MSHIATVGLEIHAQLKTRTKMFCRCANAFGRDPNTLTCPVCLGLPGALPVTNRDAIALAVRTGLALHCTIHPTSVFARKNYFYPDLPKGYQISQHDRPICTEGRVEFQFENETRTVGIERVHLEEDAGKLLHGDNLLNKAGSLVDLNRCGVPLIEIVGRPHLHSGKEAAEYLKKLRSLLRYLDVCDGNMEEGSFRCDANVSVAPEGSSKLGQKVEVKNMNSFKHVQKAIDHEIARQTEAALKGEKIPQETRLWNPDKGITSPMRSKEFANDYRYFPEPDLPPLVVPQEWIDEIRRTMPELPDGRKARFESEFGLPPYDAAILTAEKETATYYEETLQGYAPITKDKAKRASNFVMAEILRIANERNESVETLKIRPNHLAALLKKMDDGTISGKMAKEVLDEAAVSGMDPETIVRDKGMSQITDTDELRRVIRSVIDANPGQHKEFRSGKEKLFGFFVGQAMKATKGQANPALVNQILKEELARAD